MDDLKLFGESFRALTGNIPFRWQERLFQEFVAGRIPAVLDLPTGLGKTSVMAIWLIARALADDDARRKLPRRLVYVVDRRVVVDQATEEAKKIGKALGLGEDAPLVRELRLRLGLDSPGRRLLISTLRGGKADDREWTYDPAAPAIIVCTVDMAGSRLFFSGYRLSRWSRSVQAGLIGADSLIVLDEAHLAPAFLKAMQRVLFLCDETSKEVIPPLRFLPLSATPPDSGEKPDKDEKNVFHLEEGDYDDPLVAQRTGRLLPTKRIEFRELGRGKGDLAKALAGRAAEFDGKARGVVVFCNSRADANATADALLEHLARVRGVEADDVALITGARRGNERDEIVKRPTYRTFTYNDGKRDLPEDGRTRYLICTAAGEVGADLDADAAVMDLVPLERMIQRLGRVNRRGEQGEPAAVTIYYDPVALKASASEKNDRKKSEAGRLASTKALLETLPRGDGGFDASPSRFADFDQAARQAASTPPPRIPKIEREHVEAWALTSLKDHPGRPEVEPFLRGIVEEEPQTTVAWRADVAYLAQLVEQFLPLGSGRTRGRRLVRLPDRVVDQALAAARLMPAELLEAPTRDVVQFLQKRIKALQKTWKQERDTVQGIVASASLLVLRRGSLIGWGKITRDQALLTLTADGEVGSKVALDGEAKVAHDALAYTTVLLDPAIGGLDKDGALDEKCDGQASLQVQPDIDEEYQWGVVMRLVPPRADGADRKVTLLAVPPVFLGEIDALQEREIVASVRRRLGVRRAWFAELPSQREDEDGAVLEYWKHWDPEGETGASSQPELLDQHHSEAKGEMGVLTGRLGLPSPLADTLISAIAIHDTGKDRNAWKIGMGVPTNGPAYAKWYGRGPGVRGYRHEFGSLRDALYKNPARLEGLELDLKELALHLIGSHHGRVRPSILAEDGDEIFLGALDQDALEAAKRYVRLQRRWGPWGLAWLEALFRSVDATVSRRLEQEGETDSSTTTEAAE